MEKALSEQIINLLEQYSFDELTKEQQSSVLLEMTEQEFLSYRVMMNETTLLSMKQALKAPASIKVNLHEQLDGQFRRPQGLMSRVLTAGVPLWVLGLITAGLYLLWNFNVYSEKPIQDSQPMVEQIQQETKYVYLTDTIYQEVKSEPVLITKEVIKYVEVEVPVIQESQPAYVAGSQKELGLVPFTPSEIAESFDNVVGKIEIEEVLGQSVSNDRALMELLDKID